MLNESTREYQLKGGMDTKGKAMVDSMIVNHLRKGLDQKVAKATGGDYAALKNKYGAYKNMEERVAKAVNKELTTQGKKVPTFTDVISAHQIIKGIGKADPATIAAGGVLEGFSIYRKILRDPNRRIKKMFKTVDENMQKVATIKQKQINKELNLGR
jgi:hypothetical protein